MPDQEQLKKEWKEAERFEEIRVGKEHIFHRAFLRVRALPVKECLRLYLRVEMGEYGEFPLHEHNLVALTKQGEELSMRQERLDDAKEALAYIEMCCKEIAIGKEEK